MNIELYPFQKSSVDRLSSSFAAGSKGTIFVLPTGAGKTICFTNIAETASSRGFKVLILVHRKELLEQVGGHVDVFVASIGTGGTLLGIAEVLREELPKVRIVAVEPASTPLPLILAYRDHGVRTKVTGGIIADIIDQNMVDDVVQITDQTAIEMAYRLVKEEGLFAGISAGANVAVALQEAKRLEKDKVITTVLPDSMDRYLTSAHFTT